MTPALLAPVLAVAMVLAAGLVLQAQRTRQRALIGRVVDPSWRGPSGDAGESILYFSGAACTVCHTAQRPAIDALTASDPSVAVREIDVAAEPELARRYRVMSLPTTIVLGAGGSVAAVNTGFAPAERLREQLASARGVAPQPRALAANATIR